jgi:hypothetical protein
MGRTEHPLFIATLRAVFRAEDEVEAIMVADQIKVNGEKDLDEEDGDTLDVTQVTQNLAILSPEETLHLLRRARNACIRTRTKDGYDLGREMDKFIFMLKNRSEDHKGFELAGYDYGEYMEVAKEVLAGGNPIH